MNLILDPSVVVKWYLPEPLSDDAIALKEWISSEKLLVAVPELFFTESANVIWKKFTLKNEISRPHAQAIFSEILNLPFQIISDRQLLTAALEMASQFAITVYDAVYLSGAYQYQAKFVTADTVLSRRVAATHLSNLIVLLANWKSSLKL